MEVHGVVVEACHSLAQFSMCVVRDLHGLAAPTHLSGMVIGEWSHFALAEHRLLVIQTNFPPLGSALVCGVTLGRRLAPRLPPLALPAHPPLVLASALY